VKPHRWPSILRMRLRSLTRRGRVEQELDKELRFHLEQQARENRARGTPQAEAQYAALRRLGNLTQIQEECRDMRRTNYIENFLQDLRYACRTLVNNPAFTAVMVLTLALSIGANSAIFSVIDGVLLKPLPYRQPDRLFRVFVSNSNFPKFRVNPFDFLDYRARNKSFEILAGFTRSDVQLSGIDQSERLASLRVTAGFFHLLGLSPALGREFEVKDELPGNERQVILSNRLWQRRFHSDPNILGQKITLDAQPFIIIGVMPPGVEHVGNDHQTLAQGETVDAWRPFTFAGNPANRGSHFVDTIGRLKGDVTAGQATAEMNSLAAQLTREHPGAGDWRVRLIPLFQEVIGKSQRLLLVLMGAVGFVLLIACANAANLLLARATSRSREIAVRAALGAGRLRLVRQMLTESILIALLGAAVGAVIAIGGVKVLVALLPADFPRAHTIHVDATVFAFTLAIALMTGILFGLAPALQTSRTELTQALREGGRSATGSGRQLHLRSVLVVAEVSLAFVLLIGAGLMLRSFINLLHTDPGFRPEHVLTASISLPRSQYKNSAEIAGFYDRLTKDLATLPGVRYASAGSDLPWTGYNENVGFYIEGRKAADDSLHARFHGASPNYFLSLGIPLIKGRFFSDRDDAKAEQAIIINQVLARRYWPNEDALGKRITFNDTPKEGDWLKVAGIVGDVKDTPASEGAEPGLWFPLLQQPFSPMSIVIRANSDPELLINALREKVAQLDPALAVADIRQMDRIADAGMATPRFALFLVALFAFLALLLAAIGTYGVMSYSVGQRLHEFGVRIALGAKPSDVLGLVIIHGLRLALLGVVLGIVSALALGRVLQSLLYGISAGDPLTFAGVSIVAIAMASLACYLPARKATALDPMIALRSE
jgi:putative ABC transport system permease protein